MKCKEIMRALIGLAVLLCLPAAMASAASSRNLEVSDVQIRATAPGMTAKGGYVTITNNSGKADRLIAVRASFAGMADIHNMVNDDGVMKMRPVEGGLPIAAGQTVNLAPGGLHLMFMGLTSTLAPGDVHTVTLEFASGAVKRAMGMVRSPADIHSSDDAHRHDEKHDHSHGQKSEHKHDH